MLADGIWTALKCRLSLQALPWSIHTSSIRGQWTPTPYPGALSLAARAAPCCTHCPRFSQAEYLIHYSYLSPAWCLNRVLFLHNLHFSNVKKKKKKPCNHRLFNTTALLSQTLFPIVDMCTESFSQGNGFLQEHNHPGAVLCLPVSLHSVGAQYLWYQFPVVGSYWLM